MSLYPPRPRRICSVEGCERDTDARGLCQRHYNQWWRTGSTDSSRTAPSRLPAQSDVATITAVQIARHEAREDWRDDAACTGEPTDVFFPPKGAVSWVAKSICETCPVRLDCASTHLDERHGVWGGLSPRQRQRMRPAALEAGWKPSVEPYWTALLINGGVA